MKSLPMTAWGEGQSSRNLDELAFEYAPRLYDAGKKSAAPGHSFLKALVDLIQDEAWSSRFGQLQQGAIGQP